MEEMIRMQNSTPVSDTLEFDVVNLKGGWFKDGIVEFQMLQNLKYEIQNRRESNIVGAALKLLQQDGKYFVYVGFLLINGVRIDTTIEVIQGKCLLTTIYNEYRNEVERSPQNLKVKLKDKVYLQGIEAQFEVNTLKGYMKKFDRVLNSQFIRRKFK